MRSKAITVVVSLLLFATSAAGLAGCAPPTTSAAENPGEITDDSLAAAYESPADAELGLAPVHGPLASAHEPLAAAPPPQPAASSAAVSRVAAPLRPGADFRAEAATYIHDYRTIGLTPEQEAIKNAALAKLPAPCCSENSLATCCCPCNMAKAAWGLPAYLIAHEGYEAPRLEQTIRDWLGAINPNGFRGDACYNGGCARPVHQDGCGGMHEDNVL